MPTRFLGSRPTKKLMRHANLQQIISNANLLFTTLLLLLSHYALGEVVVRGKIIGYDGVSQVSYQPTTEGIFTPYWYEIQPAQNGTFRIEYECEGFGNLKVYYKKTSYRFFHGRNSKISFVIKETTIDSQRRVQGDEIFMVSDSAKRELLVKIEGDFHAINRFYNNNLRSSYFTTRMVDGNFYSNLIFKAETPNAALSVIDSLFKIEVDQINDLPWVMDIESKTIGQRDAEIKNFLINEARAFYASIFLNGINLKRFAQLKKLSNDSLASLNIYNGDWEVAIEEFMKQIDKQVSPAPNSPDYAELQETVAYVLDSYRQYEYPKATHEFDMLIVDRLFNHSKLLGDAKSQFAWQIGGLQLYLNNQIFFFSNTAPVFLPVTKGASWFAKPEVL